MPHSSPILEPGPKVLRSKQFPIRRSVGANQLEGQEPASVLFFQALGGLQPVLSRLNMDPQKIHSQLLEALFVSILFGGE